VKPGRLAWTAILALLAFAGMAGCVPTPPTPLPTAALTADEVLARLGSREQTIKSFQGRGRITFLSPERNYSGAALLKGRLPASLRVDIHDFFGRTLLSFATDGHRVQVLSAGEGKFFQGPASPRNLAAFIPPKVSLPQTLRLLVAALPLSAGPPTRFSYDPAAAQYVMEWSRNNLLQERLRVAAQGLYPVQEEYFGGSPQPRFTAEFSGFGEAAPGLPGKITLKTEAPKLELRLAYSELRRNPPLPPTDLTLVPPAGVAVVQLP
jgi:hypothetical protein